MEVSVVKKDGLYYLKDKNGNLWGGYDYSDSIRKTSKGDKGVLVGIGPKSFYIFIPKNEIFLSEPRLIDAFFRTNGFRAYYKNGQYYFTKNNKDYTLEGYDDVISYPLPQVVNGKKYHFAIVKKGGKGFFVCLDELEKLGSSHHYAEPSFENGHSLVISGNKYYFIDENFQPCSEEFDSVKDNRDGYTVKRGDKEFELAKDLSIANTDKKEEKLNAPKGGINSDKKDVNSDEKESMTKKPTTLSEWLEYFKNNADKGLETLINDIPITMFEDKFAKKLNKLLKRILKKARRKSKSERIKEFYTQEIVKVENLIKSKQEEYRKKLEEEYRKKLESDMRKGREMYEGIIKTFKEIVMPGQISEKEETVSTKGKVLGYVTNDDLELLKTNPAEFWKDVTSIANIAFRGCSSLTSIAIPEGVTMIGDSAFRGCSSLTSIAIPESVTEIGDSAFKGCSSLTSITIPEGVTRIGDFTFDKCSSLTTINIPESVTEIGDFAFNECSSLTTINIPEGVTKIGKYAFDECSSLTTINIPESVTEIEPFVFGYCEKLQEVIVPEGLEIAEDVFSGCPKTLKIIRVKNGEIIRKPSESDEKPSSVTENVSSEEVEPTEKPEEEETKKPEEEDKKPESPVEDKKEEGADEKKEESDEKKEEADEKKEEAEKPGTLSIREISAKLGKFYSDQLYHSDKVTEEEQNSILKFIEENKAVIYSNNMLKALKNKIINQIRGKLKDSSSEEVKGEEKD